MKQLIRTTIGILVMIMLLTVLQLWNGLGCAECAVDAGEIVDRIHSLVSMFGFGEYKVGADEIALYIQLDTREDIGLLVFDYCANTHEYSGGISNADKTLLKHDEQLIEVWNRKDLECSADTVNLTIQFRIITEYVDPNYENVYPESLTRTLDPISFEARFGESYSFVIAGDNINGYHISRTELFIEVE